MPHRDYAAVDDPEWLARARAFLARSCDENTAPRLAPAMNALFEHLAENGTVPFAQAVQVMLDSSDIVVKTCVNMIRKAYLCGAVRIEGEWRRGDDRRTIRILDWPS